MGRTKKRRAWLMPALAAAACAVIAAAAVLLWPRGERPVPGSVVHAAALAEAKYPQMVSGDGYYVGSYENWRNMSAEERNRILAEYEKAGNEYWSLFRKTQGSGEDLKPFLQKAMAETLKGSGAENRLSAPLNLYFALAMLSEAAAGGTRQEILDLIGAESQEALREQAEKVWQANYYDNGYVRCILGDSLWLSDACEYKQNCVDMISGSYYASVFRGEMGSDEYDRMLHDWINEQTGGLLKDSVEKLKMKEGQAAELVSTLWFQDKWAAEFSENLTETGVFHAVSGDMQAEFMRTTDDCGTYYYADRFSAYGKALNDSGAVMYFILPDEGEDMDELLQNGELQAFLTDETAVPNASVKVNLSLPRFDIAEDRKLGEVLESLGVRKVFDSSKADLGSLLLKKQNAFIADVSQGARIIVDEQGAKAAAYVTIPVYGAAPPAADEIDFVLDRPFIFVLRSRDGLPLLAGVVNAP